MDLQKVKALLALVDKSALTEFEFRENGACLRLKKEGATTALATLAAPQDIQSAEIVPSPSPIEQKVVKAPMFGVFHTSSSPNEDPFVNTGDQIRKGQKLCVLESMKIFHVMESPHDGVITNILAVSGQEVDSGTILFEIE